MFRAACAIARGFTLPVVMSLRTFSGTCRSGIGTFVVVNEDGWFVTAAHILHQMRDLNAAVQKSKSSASSSPAGGPNRHERRATKVRGPQPNDIERWSTWWGGVGTELDGNAKVLEAVDLAIGRLKNFDASKIKNYPVFKDPDKDFIPGASLCRMGFPFYDVDPVFDPATGNFTLKNVPLPIFANEGILSRMQERVPIDGDGNPHPTAPFPLRMIETSNASIKGQSGGPIFDEKGAIWGIQSSTTSYPLDFSTAEKQYYHVGVGVHAATIVGAFTQLGVTIKMSGH